jgi:choline dehydrogenase-like flavoprotein
MSVQRRSGMISRIEADWVVVGGGSAGCVLAARLSVRRVPMARARVVADASVFREVPRANTNLPTIASAERLSDLIRGARRTPARQVVGDRAAA